MRNSKYERDMEKLEKARRHTYERLTKERQKIDERFSRMQERLERKYGKPSVTQQRIIEAALELLKEDGLANLTQRKLAQKLDMQAPALYWHFENKEVLVDFMAEAILQKEFTDLQPRQADEPWEDWLMTLMSRLRRAMLAYPEGARVVAGAHLYPAVTLGKLTDIALGSMHTAGVDLQTARHIIMTATHYTFGFVIEEQAAPTSEQLAELDINEFMRPYPNMAAAMAEVDFTKSGDEDFLIGLGYIINGAGV